MTRPQSYEIRIKRSAEKEMDSLPSAIRDRIATAILSLEKVPWPRGAKRLRGQDAYRIRSGDYRILYTIEDRLRIVTIFAVGHRREVYRDL